SRLEDRGPHRLARGPILDVPGHPVERHADQRIALRRLQICPLWAPRPNRDRRASGWKDPATAVVGDATEDQYPDQFGQRDEPLAPTVVRRKQESPNLAVECAAPGDLPGIVNLAGVLEMPPRAWWDKAVQIGGHPAGIDVRRLR